MPRTTAVVVLLLLLASLARATPMTFDVDRTDDDAAATACTGAANDCSLRGAIIAANANPGADTVNVPAGTYNLTIGGAGEDAAATGDLDITDDLTINGAGAATTIVDGGSLDRVFHADPLGTGKTVMLSGLTIQHGATVLISFVLSDGGAVRNGSSSSLGGNTGGTLTLLNCVVKDSSTPRAGGGIGNVGTLVLLHTTVTGNSAGTLGGGVWQDDPGSTSITDSTISGNHADFQSGGGIGIGVFSIMTNPVVTVVRSTISGNTATSGGGIWLNRGSLSVTNSTISGNSAATNGASGAGFYNSGVPATLRSCTITANTAVGGGGGINGSATLSNTIVAGNSAGSGPDCTGTLASEGYNLIQNTSTCTVTGDTTGNVIGTDPMLAALADNGGPTLTHAIGQGSAALDAGNPAAPGSGGSACPATDQRDVARPQPVGGTCDIGAFELVYVPTTTTSTTTTSTTTTSTTTTSTTTTSTTTTTTTSTTSTTTTTVTTSSSTTATASTTTHAPTTTTHAATTSTTLPVGCTTVADFNSIACRLAVIAAEMTASSDLGKLQQTLVARVTAARDRTEDASVACANGKLRPTKNALKHAAKKVTSAVARIRSHVGRQVIPPAIAGQFTGELTPVGADLKSLQKTVKCPLGG